MRPLLLTLIVALAAPASGQGFVREAAPFPVEADGAAIAFPFAGGFFEPRPSLVDIDADGDADLVMNVGGAGLQFFEQTDDGLVWRTDRLSDIEPGNWSVFGDLDDDGDLDLLTRGDPGRVRYWRNVGTAQAPAFEIGADPLLDADGQPVYVEDSSIPELGDLDGDGDPDLFSGKADVGTISHYRLDGLSARGVPQFAFVTDRFQDIVVYEENPMCQDGRVIGTPGRPAPQTGGPPNMPQRGSMHGANAIAIADITGDGAPELFWGDFFTPSLFYFLNEGTESDPVLALAGDRYPVGQPLTSGGYNAPSWGDADGDGDLDLVVGVQRGLCFQSQTTVSNLFRFENVGTPTAPDFRLVTDRLIRSLDVGSRSTVAFADLDGDGDLDMVTANESDPENPNRASLDRYENAGTASAPAFRLAERDWLGLEYDYGAYAPAFGDLDGDGDLDLIVGGFNGRFVLLRNTGTAGAPQFTRVDDRWGGIDTGQYARGSLGDLDGDGDLDLLGGASNGTIRLYINTGTASEPAFVTQGRGTPGEADAEFQASIGLPDTVGGDSAPAFADLDGDGDLDVVVGTAEGELKMFENVGTPTAPRFQEAAPVPAGRRRTAPALADLDGDGRPEIVAGTAAGGFLFWRGGSETSGEPGPSPNMGLRAVPNPSSGAVAFRADAPRGDLRVFDAQGRRVAHLALVDGRAEWDGGASAAGVYLARLDTPAGTATASFTRVR